MNPFILASARMLARRRKTGGGFLGEVASKDFIDGDHLALMIGLSAGVSQNTEAGWLHFKDPADGKTKYVAKKPLRHTLSWDDINAVGAVFGKTISLLGKNYQVRLLKGSSSAIAEDTIGGYDHPTTHGSEWNRLMYHIVAKPFTEPKTTLASEGITEGDWSNYTDIELSLHRSSPDNGEGCWCQERQTSSTAYRILRGYYGVSFIFRESSGYATASYGWRPVLELID